MHLRHTAQAVSVLNSRIVSPVRFPNLAAVEQYSQMPGRGCLPSMGPGLLDPRIESSRSSTQRLERHRASNVGDLDETLCIVKRECCDGSHSLRAIQQRKTFFRFEPQRSQFGLPQCLAAAYALPMIKSFSFTNENQREMRKWGKIAARAHGTLFRDDWMNSSIEKARQHFDNRSANSAEAPGEDICAKQKHGPNFGL
jgi:hypothetical protein